jgi:inner membrane protein
MASAFGHAYAAFVMGKSFYSKKGLSWLIFTGIVCSIVPDLDVVSFSLGIPYESFWGHRGFTHSFVFSIILGFASTFLFEQNIASRKFILIWFYLFACTASHAILDAMTSGGLGVAFFAPFDNTRYFLPWRPIKVSPIGASKFFGEWGLKVLLNEAIWIGIPSTIYLILVAIFKRLRSK